MSAGDVLIDGVTLSEWRECRWWPNGNEARINAGYAGHDREIVAVIEPYDIDEQIPREVGRALQCLLDGWLVEYRSTRIELHPSGTFNGGFTAEDVQTARRALSDLGLVVVAVDIGGPGGTF